MNKIKRRKFSVTKGSQIIMLKLKAVLFALVNLLFGSLPAAAQGPSQAANPGAPVVEVPMILRGSTPAVEVMVNGKGPFLFVIDTGAMGAARADSSLVERLKLPVVGKMRAGDGSGRSTSLDVVRLDSVSIGGLQFNNLRAPTRDYNRSPAASRVDGILGFDLFSDYLLTLDFPGKRVRIERGQTLKADGADVMSYDGSGGAPVVELGLGGRKLRGRIDTGNSIGGFVLPESLVKTLALASEPVVVGRARTVSSVVEIKVARLKDSIRLGRHEFPEPRVVFPALSGDVNVGSAAFGDYAVTFDQKNRLLRLEKHARPAEPAPSARVEVPEPRLYVGRFGSRTISLEGSVLYLQRQGGPKLKLLPVSEDVFTLEAFPDARVKFVRGAKGEIVELQVLNLDGEWEKSAKEMS